MIQLIPNNIGWVLINFRLINAKSNTQFHFNWIFLEPMLRPNQNHTFIRFHIIKNRIRFTKIKIEFSNPPKRWEPPTKISTDDNKVWNTVFDHSDFWGAEIHKTIPYQGLMFPVGEFEKGHGERERFSYTKVFTFHFLVDLRSG